MTVGHVVDLWSEGDGIFRPNRPAWQKKARCGGNVDLFFNESNQRMTAQAKKICAMCPVRRQCLKHAVDHNETNGVWGGLTTVERERNRRAKR